MPRYCCVKGCRSIKGEGNTFHRFPKDELLKRKWVSFVTETGGESKPHSEICSVHFDEQCYTNAKRNVGII